MTFMIGSSSTGRALRTPSLKAAAPANSERDRARLGVALRSVEHRHFDVDDGIARDHAGGHLLTDALIDGRDSLRRHAPARDGVDELVAMARGQRLEPQRHLRLLVAAAELTARTCHPARQPCESSRGRRPAAGRLRNDAELAYSRSTTISRCSSPMPRRGSSGPTRRRHGRATSGPRGRAWRARRSAEQDPPPCGARWPPR